MNRFGDSSTRDGLPVGPLCLTDSAVILFRVDLNPSSVVVADCRTILTAEERIRADRFVTDQLTRRFTVCRSVLRRLLGSALAVSAPEVGLVLGPHGKPALPPGLSDVEFNVSHTGDLALVALTRKRPLGVDVESLGERQSQDELAARFFSSIERRAYFALPESQRLAAFYRIWTCKEAFLKATGSGLSFPLGRFSVSAAPDQPPGLLHVDDDPAACERWSFVIPEVGPNVAAALAVAGHGWTLSCRTWEHEHINPGVADAGI